jgi:hypothetical protein
MAEAARQDAEVAELGRAAEGVGAAYTVIDRASRVDEARRSFLVLRPEVKSSHLARFALPHLSPRESGDPIRQLRGFSATEYRMVRDNLVVHYSVHNRIPMVTVWRFEPGPGHPLAPPSGNGK